MSRYEVIYNEDYIVYEDEWGYAEWDTGTFSEVFEGTHIELLDHIKQMRAHGLYNITAESLYGDDSDY